MRSLILLLILQDPTCWRGRPLPHCAAFVVTDFTYLKRLGAPPTEDVMAVTGELGVMANTGPRTAWGATVVKSLGTDRSYVAIRPRYRRWLNDETSVDLSPGILLWGDHDRFRPRFPSFTAHATLDRGDIVGATLGVEAIRGGPGGAEVTWYGGLRFGSYLGPVAAGLFLAMVVLAFAGETT